MRKKWILLAALSLGGCGSSGDHATSAQKANEVPAVPATAEGCAGIHGDPPRAVTSSPTGTLFEPLNQFCAMHGGEVLSWNDSDGTLRQACLHVPTNASAKTPLPLITFLQGSMLPADPQSIHNAWELLNGSADLSGDPARPGFILLVPYGRDTEHFYSSPNDASLGWDNWYRNFDRSDPAINRDVMAIDHFIAEVKGRGIVDPKRVYLTGWSNGGAMGILYALNTPGIAATAVYSNVDPFSTVLDPCSQPPFGNNLRPIMTVHNDCDIGGLCQTGGRDGLGRTFAQAMPQLEYRGVIIDVLQQETSSCDAQCTSATGPGTARHLTWPYLRNDQLFQFLREHPLNH